MTMRLLALMLACLACTSQASTQGSSSQALAQLLTSSQDNVVDKIANLDETEVAKALFSTATFVLAAYELHAQFGKVKDMDKELTVDAALVVASFLKTLQATSKIMIPMLPEKVVPDMLAHLHEHEVAEVLFVTAGLTLGIYELVTHWQTVVDMEKEIKGATALTVSKFLKVLEKTWKTTKSSMETYKSVR